MLTVHQLMMKDTHLSHVLNSTGAPFSIENCIEYTDECYIFRGAVLNILTQ